MINWLKKLFSKKEPVAQVQITETPKLLEKPCRNCGKPVFYDPSWEHIPNYCKACKQEFVREKEEKQRAGEPRKIRRKCIIPITVKSAE